MSVKIHPVQRRLLSHQDQFPDTPLCQPGSLLYQTLHRHTAITAAHFGNDTVGAVLITPFRNLQISIMAACRHHTIHTCQRFLLQAPVTVMPDPLTDFLQSQYDLVDRHGTDNGIHLRDFLLDFFPVTLGETPRHNQPLNGPALPQFCHLQNGIDAFFLGIVDKAAGIDHHHIRFPLVIGKLISVLQKHPQHHLGIHQILVTAERYKQYFLIHASYSLSDNAAFVTLPLLSLLPSLPRSGS